MKRNSCEIRPNPYSRKETNKTKKLTVFYIRYLNTL